jgi:hypothetical protein
VGAEVKGGGPKEWGAAKAGQRGAPQGGPLGRSPHGKRTRQHLARELDAQRAAADDYDRRRRGKRVGVRLLRERGGARAGVGEIGARRSLGHSAPTLPRCPPPPPPP